MTRHGAALQKSLVDLEVPPSDTAKQVSERAILFRISCNAMMNVSVTANIAVSVYAKIYKANELCY